MKSTIVYGEEMPVWTYSITYACGCKVEGIECASMTPITDSVFDFPCQICNPSVGVCNVWD